MQGPQGPRTLGAYQVGAPLGSGPVGNVVRALGPDGRDMALKILRGQFAASPGVRQRFLAISTAVAQLDHPHILPLENAGEQNGQTFAAMPFVAQGSLAGRFAHGRLSPKDIAPLFNQICDALNYLHGQNMTHGNLKPTNVMLFEGKHCLISDFGQLWQVAEVDLTQSGVSADAVFYMAPEQREGFVDIRSDIYSLGALLFQALTGSPPFLGQTPFEVLSRHQRQPVPPFSAITPLLATGAQVFEEVVRMALAKDPAARFQTPLAMARAITEAGALANDLPSKALPIVTPGMVPPGGPPAVPMRPPGNVRPGFGPMPGQMISRPVGGPPSGPMRPPGMPPGPPVAGPGMTPFPGAGLMGPTPGQMTPPARQRIPSQPLPPQLPPQAPPDDPLRWIFGESQGAPPALPPPGRMAPAPPPNMEMADFLTARHAAPDPLEIDETRQLPPPTETGQVRREDGRWWDRDGFDDGRDYTGSRSMVDGRGWDDESRGMSVPSMQVPARPASRDRWEESDAGFGHPGSRYDDGYDRRDDYRRRDDGYDDASREMTGFGRGAPARNGRAPYASYDDGFSQSVAALDPLRAPQPRPTPGGTRQSLVIPASKKKRRSPVPLILGILIAVVVVANLGVLIVLAPQRCPNHICDELHAKLAPLFGIAVTPTLTVTVLSKSGTLAVPASGNKTYSDVLSLSSSAIGNLTWQITSDQNWVAFDPAGGTLTPGQTATIGLTLSPDVTVAPGSYPVTITITAGGGTAKATLTVRIDPSGG
jgi:serine/threonine protein kinase